MMKVLENPDTSQKKKSMPSSVKASFTNKINPVLCGTAFKNKGIQPFSMLSSLGCPLPSTAAPSKASTSKPEKPLNSSPQMTAPLAALAFKIMSDPYVGRLTFVRIYGGTLTKGTNLSIRRKINASASLASSRCMPNQRKDRDEFFTGDIAACIGLKYTSTGDTLCAEENRSSSRKWISLSLLFRWRSNPNRKPTGKNLRWLSGPSLKKTQRSASTTNEETGQTIIAGMGELHLEILRDRMFREFAVEANVGKPEVAYKETITIPGEIETKYIKQSGGRGQYAHVCLEIEPNEKGKGNEIVSKIVGGVIPKEYIHLLYQRDRRRPRDRRSRRISARRR